ncbi:MAG: VWA domain-containing protein [Planctomycetes bacterium]|nr:VWA domain-containing protein [Planctomycetota bacterium]
MRFESPWALLVTLAIPLLIAFSGRGRGWGSVRFSATAQVKGVGKSIKQRLLWLPLAIRILALLLLAVALARPQEGTERVHDISKGIAIEMVVDRSGSMGAEMGFAGRNLSRLEVVKRVFDEFVSGKGDLPGRPNDLIGMIVFARYADTICPLTLGHGALAQFLKNVQLVTQRSEDGTAVGDAIALAAARLKTAEETLARQADDVEKEFSIKSKIIILLTDGQNNAGKRMPREAAALAKKWGIKIYTIGVGGGDGVVTVQTIFGPRKMRTGSGVDTATLQAVAEETGGIFRLADDADSLRAVYEEIDKLERSEIESVRYLDYRELFPPFLLAAMGLLVIEVCLNCTLFRKIP